MEDTNDRIIEESTSLKKESNWETQFLTGLIFPAGLGELMNVWKTFFIFWVKLSHSREKKEKYTFTYGNIEGRHWGTPVHLPAPQIT